MKKEILKYIPFNLFWCLSTLGLEFLLLHLIWKELTLFECITLSLIVYLYDVKQSSFNDYLVDKIKELEEKTKHL